MVIALSNAAFNHVSTSFDDSEDSFDFTDENGNTTVARLGMKLDLLFDRLLTYDAEEAPQGIEADAPVPHLAKAVVQA